MKVFLDADASPVTKEVVVVCEEYNLELIVVKNYLNELNCPYGEIITVDNYKEAADMYIANHLDKGDIVITGDYGLAALVLSRLGKVINFNGDIINNHNIDSYINMRHLNAKLRREKKIYTQFKKRTTSQNKGFYLSFKLLVERYLAK